VELQEWFDRQHFEESSLRKAWKETRNEDIAARLIGHIRRAAVEVAGFEDIVVEHHFLFQRLR
ncbi:hypothetical protein J4U56_25905, partial [Escherichia coli]